jgi:hypothetical protein
MSTLLKNHENRLKHGRGQGRGKDYVPFIQISDNRVASEGWLTRSLGWKTKRIHHTLSRHEYHYLLVQEWADCVVDIREQFPLDYELTKRIADQLGIRHPHLNGQDVVMTSDFNLIVMDKSGVEVERARTIKPVNKLTKRTLELFEIERRYYLELGIPWSVVFDKGKPTNLIKNIDWLYDAKDLGTREGIDEEMVTLVSDRLFDLLAMLGDKESISKNCLKCDVELGLTSGTSLYILRHMLANKHWETNMNELIRENRPLKLSMKKQIVLHSIRFA